MAELRAPVIIAEFDLSTPDLIRILSPAPAIAASVFVRAHGEPIGTVHVEVGAGGLDVSVVRGKVVDELSTDARTILGVDLATKSGWLEVAKPTNFARMHSAYVGKPDRIAVLVCTRERPEALKRCLESLTGQDHLNFSVWIIDNAPHANVRHRESVPR